jgi:NAD-dependent SIR2 family protein deacetylase
VNPSRTSETVFLLGAGASVAAGVPDTRSFVEQFVESIEDDAKKRTIEKIVGKLKKWKMALPEDRSRVRRRNVRAWRAKPPDLDIELLLETLTKLRDKEQEPLLQFYDGGQFLLDGQDYPKSPLIDDLKDFIKRKAIVADDKIHYLRPLLEFTSEHTQCIISVNYDTCIEQFCADNQLSYEDGFDISWNPMVFDREHTDINLYKLHGSVLWYQSDRGSYIKLPIRTAESRIELITGEQANSLMLYPVQKWGYAEPFLELLVMTKRLIEACNLLIVVGYSFRDDYLIRMLWDAARKNKDLRIILIDPNAYAIYDKKLRYYDDMRMHPSHLSGKVICLPYTFERAFPNLKNHYVKHLRLGLSEQKKQRESELHGMKPEWISTVREIVEADYAEEVEKISKCEDYSNANDYVLDLKIPLVIGMHKLAASEYSDSREYFNKFIDVLHELLVNKLAVELSASNIAIMFNYSRSNGGASYLGPSNMREIITKVRAFYEMRERMVTDLVRQRLSKLTNGMSALCDYFEPFKMDTLDDHVYSQLRDMPLDADGNKLKLKIQEFEREKLKQILQSMREDFVI